MHLKRAKYDAMNEQRLPQIQGSLCSMQEQPPRTIVWTHPSANGTESIQV